MRFILFFFTAAAMGVAALAQDTNLHTNVHELYLQDQGDRGVGGGKAVTNWQDLVKRDNARRGRVRELLASGALKTAEDFHEWANSVFRADGRLRNSVQSIKFLRANFVENLESATEV